MLKITKKVRFLEITKSGWKWLKRGYCKGFQKVAKKWCFFVIFSIFSIFCNSLSLPHITWFLGVFPSKIGAVEGQNKAKIGQKWSKMVFFGPFRKSSKKNFNFALIRPFFGGVHSPWKWGSIFAPFGSRPYENLYYVYRFAYYLVTPFFSGPGGAPRGTPQIWHFWRFCDFCDFWCFFGHFWPFFGCFFGDFWGSKLVFFNDF